MHHNWPGCEGGSFSWLARCLWSAKSYHVDGIVVALDPVARTMDVEIAAPEERRRIGNPVPAPAEYRGRVVAINFIYTRCPLPDVCPRLSASFAA